MWIEASFVSVKGKEGVAVEGGAAEVQWHRL